MEKGEIFQQEQPKAWGKQVENGGLVLEQKGGFCLAETLECGQCFRWERTGQGAYEGVAYGKKARLREQAGTILLEGVTPEDYSRVWHGYFDLGLDYGQVRETLCQTHERLREMAEFAPGIRILRQEPWETLCSFLLSQNNNIPRIKGIVRRLCEQHGEPTEGGYAFPSVERVASLDEEGLAGIRSGFRAKYLLGAARKIASGEIDLEALRDEEIGAAREKLQELPGVGPKVAECVLLYGLHRLEAFPMDVWMKRAMAVFFPDYQEGSFGAYGGIAQQYIYHYSRLHREEL